MKATLTFTLPEEAEEHRLALDGNKWCAAVSAFDGQLRQTAKYNEGQEAEHAKWARELLHQMLSAYGLEIP